MCIPYPFLIWHPSFQCAPTNKNIVIHNQYITLMSLNGPFFAYVSNDMDVGFLVPDNHYNGRKCNARD